MKGLKIGAIASVSILIVMMLLVGYLFLTAEVRVVDITAQGFSASDDTSAFDALKKSVEEGTFQGTLFHKPSQWNRAEDYIYLTYTLRIRNDCLVPIDMLEVQVVPQSSDVLQLADFSIHSLDLKSEGDLTVRVLAPRDTNPVRELIVTYYLWGVSGSLKTTYTP